MTNRLEPIILQKQQEVRRLQSLVQTQPKHPIADILSGKTKRTSGKNFKSALYHYNHSSLAVIAEIKRKSPSKGLIAHIDDPIALAKKYIKGGANALSILTDELFFGGSLEDLSRTALNLQDSPIPVLRKDFIIHEIQIAESIIAGADAILCIVAVLGEKTKIILDHAKKMGIEVLVEIHHHQELEIALASGAEIIGVNNRNLSTFDVDTQQALKLIEKIPDHIIRVAESGILNPELAQTYYQAGFNAVLIGEALVTSSNPAEFIKACRHA